MQTNKVLLLFSSFILCLLPITSYYVVGSVYLNSYLMIVLFSIMIVLFILNGLKIDLIKLFLLIFLFYFLCATLFHLAIESYEVNVGNLLLMCLVSFVVVILFDAKLAKNIFIKTYSFFSIALLWYFIVQLLLYYVFGIKIGGQIPFLSLHEGFILSNHTFGISESTFYISFSSLFSERAHLVLYCTPFLYLKMFGIQQLVKKSIPISVIVSFLLILTFSGSAIIMVGICWITFLLFGLKTSFVKKMVYSAGLLFILSSMYYLLSTTQAFNSIFERLFVSENGSSKADYRIYRGFALFFNMPFERCVFGIGFKNLFSYSTTIGLSSIYDSDLANAEYLNSVSQVLIYFGIIGALILVLAYYYMFKKGTTVSNSTLISFIIFSFSSSIFLDAYWVLYMCVVFCLIEVSPYEKEGIEFSRS